LRQKISQTTTRDGVGYCLLPGEAESFGGQAPREWIDSPESPGKTVAYLLRLSTPTLTWQLVHGTGHICGSSLWFARGENTGRFLKEYEVPDELIKYRTFEQRYLLIGHRADVENSTYAAIRQQHQQFDERFMSWDSLSPTPQLSDALTAQVDKYGYHAVMIQPTIKLGPGMAAAYAHIKDKQKAVWQHARYRAG